MNMMRRSNLRLLAGAAMAVSLGGCVTVKTPDKPIEINLNVKIDQEVRVVVDQKLDQAIQQNPGIF